MRKKLVCMLLALATVATMSVVASAQSVTTDTALLEKILAQEEARRKDDLSGVIQKLNAAQQPSVTENTPDGGTSLLEKISAQEGARSMQDLPAMIQILDAASQQSFVVEHSWYDAAGNKIDDPALLEELQKFEQNQAVCEHSWYNAAGSKIEDLQLIAALWSGMAKGVVSQPCCGNPSPVAYSYEQHLYHPGTAPLCISKRTDATFCQNCYAMLSSTLVSEVTHTHG